MRKPDTFLPTTQLVQRAMDIYDNLPPTYPVPTDWKDGRPIEWMDVANDSGCAAFDALEEAREPITVEAISILRSHIDRQLKKRR